MAEVVPTEQQTGAIESNNVPVPPPLTQQQKAQMIADEDPLLISQSLTYVTDDGSTLHSFNSEPYSLSELSLV